MPFLRQNSVLFMHIQIAAYLTALMHVQASTFFLNSVFLADNYFLLKKKQKKQKQYIITLP